MSDYDCREAEAIHLLHPGSADDHRGGEDVPRRLGRGEGRLAGGDWEGEEEAGRGETLDVSLLHWESETVLFQDIVCASVDVDMPKVDEGLTDPFETIFAKRGEVQKRSGSRKLVSFIFISLWQFIIEFCVGNSGCMNALFIDSQSPEHIIGENDRRTGRTFF